MNCIKNIDETKRVKEDKERVFVESDGREYKKKKKRYKKHELQYGSGKERNVWDDERRNRERSMKGGDRNWKREIKGNTKRKGYQKHQCDQSSNKDGKKA